MVKKLCEPNRGRQLVDGRMRCSLGLDFSFQDCQRSINCDHWPSPLWTVPELVERKSHAPRHPVVSRNEHESLKAAIPEPSKAVDHACLKLCYHFIQCAFKQTSHLQSDSGHVHRCPFDLVSVGQVQKTEISSSALWPGVMDRPTQDVPILKEDRLSRAPGHFSSLWNLDRNKALST
ncbi:hypothetical protein O181_013235 [Austropuccinia psidii MF-1]|uniref:Uncharacterized protein n=1 Tax=Austropuccinia psidii MF-1 TaxID=1389203 RepID=A0A9Q3BZG6_9BASI|nr:hypothetical protein [Austropuccinia psidii MF-1]